VVVHRRSEYDELIARHGTRQQAAFYLESRDRSLDEVVARHEALESAMQVTAAAIPAEWRRADVERSDLARFVFGPEDVVVVVGQDGLVANVAKYLDGHPVVGIDPEPERNPGVLVPHAPRSAAELLRAAVGGAAVQERTMVEATTDDGQSIRALNEVYVGHASHQSARYQLQLPDGTRERQSSSGVLAGTGTGATGWLRSAWQERRSPIVLPRPDAPGLCWFVREAWPSPGTGTSCTEGDLGADEALTVLVESDQLVCFGDGIEGDALQLTWGNRLVVRRAPQCLRLVGA
jgi:NAD kinase